MRTSIFNEFAQMSERFLEDFAVLWQLPAEQRMALIPHVVRIFRTRITGHHKRALDEAVSQIGGNAADVLRSLSLLLFIHGKWNPHTDTPEGFLRDLAELRIVPEEKAVEAKAFLIEFLAAVQSDDKRRLERSAAASMLPSLKGCDTLVEFRAVISNPFGAGLDDKITDYEPRCVSLVPLVLVEIRRDSGDPLSFQFQCEEDDLDVLIDACLAAKKDLAAARAALDKRQAE